MSQKVNVQPNEKLSEQSTCRKKVYKIIVIGDSNVGKTCLTYRFCEGKFLRKSETTIGVDFRERSVEVDGEEIKLQLWDTAGEERFRKCMVKHYYRNVHAVVLVYDVTKMSSFQSLAHWIQECNQNNLTNEIPRILVGNKCDLTEKQVVKTSMAQRFADGYGMPLFETSAMDDSECNHVESIFLTLAHKLKSCRPMSVHSAGSITLTHDNSGSNTNEPDSCSC